MEKNILSHNLSFLVIGWCIYCNAQHKKFLKDFKFAIF